MRKLIIVPVFALLLGSAYAQAVGAIVFENTTPAKENIAGQTDVDTPTHTQGAIISDVVSASYLGNITK